MRAKAWINYGTVSSSWSPKAVTVMKPKLPLEQIPRSGEVENYFTLVNNFKFNGQILSLHSEKQAATALSTFFLASLGQENLYEQTSRSAEQFYRELILNLINENFWVSLIFKHGWSSFNRSARLLAVLFTMSLISAGNTFLSCSKYRKCIPETPIQIGPVQFSVRQFYLAISQALVVTIPVGGLMMLMNFTVPLSLTNYKYSNYWNSSRYIRPLVYAFVSMISFILLTISMIQDRSPY